MTALGLGSGSVGMASSRAAAGSLIVYLLFFWTFVPFIVAFIEFLILITMTDDAFAAKYGRPLTA